jgi:hypothetical protein
LQYVDTLAEYLLPSGQLSLTICGSWD